MHLCACIHLHAIDEHIPHEWRIIVCDVSFLAAVLTHQLKLSLSLFLCLYVNFGHLYCHDS